MVVDKEVSSLDDLKGLRFFVYGQFWTELLANLGLTPASGVLIFEVYDAIDKGVIDGAHTNLSFCNTLKLWEVAKYWDIGAHHFTSGGWDITGIINKDTWDSFSKQTQDVFYDVFSVEFTDRKAQQNIELEQGWKDQIKAMPDVNLVSFFPPETNDIVQQAFEKTKEDIFNKWDSKGAHTREVYENFLKHVDKYDKELADKGYPWER
jgi:TRAP-type C4-dicarboxylate transport system substrate-binding protein